MKLKNLWRAGMVLLLAGGLFFAGCSDGDGDDNGGGGREALLNVPFPILDVAGDHASVTALGAANTTYTGAIVWKTASDHQALSSGTFAADTAYEAVITLMKVGGGNFDGTGANHFKVAGLPDANVVNAAVSGSNVATLDVTVTFLKIADLSDLTKGSADGNTLLLPTDGKTADTTVADGTGYKNGTVSWATGLALASGKFEEDSNNQANIYKAVITLEADTGYTFTNIADTDVGLNGDTGSNITSATVTSITENGAKIVITVVFAGI